jgi:hypothetical protein
MDQKTLSGAVLEGLLAAATVADPDNGHARASSSQDAHQLEMKELFAELVKRIERGDLRDPETIDRELARCCRTREQLRLALRAAGDVSCRRIDSPSPPSESRKEPAE